MKFNFRKIASAAASTFLVGSTIALAAAASYPAPFAQGGTADVGIVYGTAGATSDIVAATNIQVNLEGALRDQGAGSGGAPTGGDFVLLSKDKNKLNMGDGPNAVYSSIDDGELSVVLASGVYTNDVERDDFDYDQKITLGNWNTLTHFQDNDYNNDVPAVGFALTKGDPIFNYTLDFTPDAVDGGENLVNLETTDLTMLGKTWYVLDAGNTTATNFKLDLLDSADTGTVKEGETVTVRAGDSSYDVSIDFIDADSASLVINGEVTDDLSEGQTQKLADGSYIGIKDVRKLAVAGELGTVEFSIGSGKLELQNGEEVKLNNEKISTLYDDNSITAYISVSGGTDVDDIVLEWKADGDAWIAEGTDLTMPGFDAVKITSDAFYMADQENTHIGPGGSDSFKLSTTVTDGDVSFNYLYGNGTDFTGIGKDSNDLLYTRNGTGTSSQKEVLYDMDDYSWFVVSWKNGDDHESYVLDVTDIDDSTPSKNTTQIESVADGSNVGVTLDIGESDDIGEIRLTLNAANEDAGTATINVTAAGGTGTVYINKLITNDGLTIQLPYNSTEGTGGAVNLSMPLNTDATWVMNLTEEDSDENVLLGGSFTVTHGWTSSKTTITTQSDTIYAGGDAFETSDGSDDYVGYMNTSIATKTIFHTGGDEDDLDVYYPGSESYAQVFIAEAGASSGNGGVDLGSMVVFDSEVQSVSAHNLIVVGGSCVNTVASTLLGGAGCGSSFESASGVGAGEFLIQSFSSPYSGSKVATLVAGYNAADTTNAVAYLTNSDHDIDTTAGKKYVGTDGDTAQLM